MLSSRNLPWRYTAPGNTKAESLRSSLIIAVILGILHSPPFVRQKSYAKVGDIPIGGPLPPQWDYLTVDAPSSRAYVSHGSEVVVIDTAADRVVGRIAGTPGVHGIAVGAGRVFTSNGREDTVSVIDPLTLVTLRKIDSGGANPDAITFDPSTQTVWVFNHTGRSATEIAAATGQVRATIPLTGTAESGQADGAGRVFVNIEDNNQIDVIDVAAKTVSASWPVAPGSSPTGMYLDRDSHRLFVGAGKFMLMIDAYTGKVITSVPICSGTDATWYDATTRLAFSSCRDGHITVAIVEGATMTVVQTIETSPGSRTMGIDLTTHKLYLAAAIPKVGGGRGYDPDSFHVLVYGLQQN
jgi:DNA-binding beta-propeller fold protein YncE